jgi:hypothetical protein
MNRSLNALIEDIVYQQARKVALARVQAGIVNHFTSKQASLLDDFTNADAAYGYIRAQQAKNERDLAAIYSALETDYGIFFKESGRDVKPK